MQFKACMESWGAWYGEEGERRHLGIFPGLIRLMVLRGMNESVSVWGVSANSFDWWKFKVN